MTDVNAATNPGAPSSTGDITAGQDGVGTPIKLRILVHALILFIPALANATSATISVNDFGAKGDSTTLDTAAIQKAIDTAAPTSATYEPRGLRWASDYDAKRVRLLLL